MNAESVSKLQNIIMRIFIKNLAMKCARTTNDWRVEKLERWHACNESCI